MSDKWARESRQLIYIHGHKMWHTCDNLKLSHKHGIYSSQMRWLS